MNDTPPALIEPEGVLIKILKRHSDKGRRKPKMFPATVLTAAQYWMSHQEPPDDYREGVTEIRKNDQLVGYETPYHNRLARTLRAFLSLKHIHQVAVIDAAERKIYWRGEDMDFFPKYVKEAEEMAKDIKAYQDKHSALIQGLGVGDERN